MLNKVIIFAKTGGKSSNNIVRSTGKETCASRGVSCWQYCLVHRQAMIQHKEFQVIRSHGLCSQLQNHVPSKDYSIAVPM